MAVLSLYDKVADLAGWGSHLLVESWEDHNLKYETIDGRYISRLRIRSPCVRGKTLRGLFAFALSVVRTAVMCRRLIRDQGISIVNVHFPDARACIWTVLRKVRLFRGAVVLSFHGADVAQFKEGLSRCRRVVWHIMLKECAAVTACSRQLAGELRVLFPASAEKICLLPNGVDAERIYAEVEVSRTDARRANGRYLLCIAGFERKKGIDILLHSFADVRESDNELRLLILCRNGPNAAGTYSLIKDLGLEGSVSIEVDCPHNVAMSKLAGAVALVVPSRREPFGLVALEAAVLGRPIIMTNVCGVLETLDRSLVTVVEADDAAALTKGIFHVLADNGAAEAKSCRLKEMIIGVVDWSRAAQVLVGTALTSPETAGIGEPE